MAQTARITKKSDAIVEELHLITGKSKATIIELALEEYRFHEKMRLFNEAYAKLRSDKEAWEEEVNERTELEGTLEDGFENE